MAGTGSAEVVRVRVWLVHRTHQEDARDGGAASTAPERGGGQCRRDLLAALSPELPDLALGGGLVPVQLSHDGLGGNQLQVQRGLLRREVGLLDLQAVLLLLQALLLRLKKVAFVGDLGDQVRVGLGHVVHDLQAIREIRQRGRAEDELEI